jgi:hypothetical protein
VSDPTPTTPDLRLSPDGKSVAWRFPDGGWGWRNIHGPYFSLIAPEAEVADWTPLVPAPVTVDLVRDRIEKLEDLLREAAAALWALSKAVIVVRPSLTKPYTDAPDHTPWSRFVQPAASRAYNLKVRIGRHLRTVPSSAIGDTAAGPAADEGQVQRGSGDEVLDQLREVRHVAQTLHDVQCGCGPGEPRWHQDDDPTYLAMARAAFEAMREVRP